MKKLVAIPVDQVGILDAHFGHCKFFALVKVENGEIVSEEKIIPPPHEPGLLPRWLSEKGATDIIAGGMGQKAILLFNQSGVNVFVGAPRMNAKELTLGLLNNTLSFTANYCNHDHHGNCENH